MHSTLPWEIYDIVYVADDDEPTGHGVPAKRARGTATPAARGRAAPAKQCARVTATPAVRSDMCNRNHHYHTITSIVCSMNKIHGTAYCIHFSKIQLH